MNFITSVSQQLLMIIMVLLSVAFFTLMERKILASMQIRVGPEKVGPAGFLQPFADALKLLTKDDAPVIWSNSLIYYLAPLLMMFLSLISWSVVPIYWGVINNPFSFLTMIIIYGLTVYGLMWSGWSSNSSYSMLGSIRSVSQTISYEVVFSFIILSIISTISCLSIEGMNSWELMKISIMNPFLFLLTCLVMLIEMGRTPFDLPEGESELVSGYSVEYGGGVFILIFLSENIMIFFSSFVLSFFFIWNYLYFMGIMMFSFIVVMVVVMRGVLPRIRYDKLMLLCWKVLTPFVLILFNIMYLTSNFILSSLSLLWTSYLR